MFLYDSNRGIALNLDQCIEMRDIQGDVRVDFPEDISYTVVGFSLLNIINCISGGRELLTCDSIQPVYKKAFTGPR